MGLFTNRGRITEPPVIPVNDFDRVWLWANVQTRERVMIDAGPLQSPEAPLMHAIRSLSREVLALRQRVDELERWNDDG